MPDFSFKSKVAFPKTEVLEKPPIISYFDPCGYKSHFMPYLTNYNSGAENVQTS